MIDLLFVVDGSGSICDNDPTRQNDGSGCDNWKQIVNFITEFVSVMEPSEKGTHVGVVTFSTESDLLMKFNRFVLQNVIYAEQMYMKRSVSADSTTQTA